MYSTFRRRRHALPRYKPAFDDILQWLDGKQTALGYYDGATYNTVTKSIEITSDWKCFYDRDITPTSPDGNECFVSFGNDWTFYITASGDVFTALNGISVTQIGSGVILKESNNIKLGLKIGSIECVVNGASTITNVTFSSLVFTKYTLGKTGWTGVASFTGFGGDWSDCQGSYKVDQTYPEVVTTDPNGTYRKYNQLPDKSGNGNNGLYDNDLDLYNVDPNGVLETALGLSAGTLNGFKTREQYNTIFTDLYVLFGKYIAYFPKNDQLVFLSVIFDTLFDDDFSEVTKNLKYVRRYWDYVTNNGILVTFNGEPVTNGLI